MMKYVDDTSDRGLVLNPTRKWDGNKEHEFVISGRSDSDNAKDSIIAERTGAGTNQLTIGPNPNPRLNFISGISRYLAHILCTFLFLSLGGEISRKLDSFGRGYSGGSER
jgi:hypothetical protein